MRIKKKYESGAATNYVSRGRALKKLQLPLKDFRRLCILKGIYPHEPLHRKKVNRGSSENRIFYYVKDINFLASEPIIEKFRKYKIFLRKLKTAKAKREEDRMKALYERRPEYQLDHIVKERYPTFESSLRDLDDALCMLFAFSVLPHTKIITTSLIASCRRLTAEFNHFIIESKSLSKVFISIKGIYYQAEVMGERITWVVAHDRGVGHVTEVDFSVMATFVEFYVAMMKFVNFRLYQSVGLYYPPKINHTVEQAVKSVEEEDRIYSLACPLSKCEDYEEEQIDMTIGEDIEGDIDEKLQLLCKRKNLFANFRFWLNRETPKDALTIVIRNCGGSVSWENCPVSLYNENDARITHTIIDRPLSSKRVNINRCYVQPQWVFDCFNKCELVAVDKYLPGAALPPHLSPFTSDSYANEEEQLQQIQEIVKKDVSRKSVAKGSSLTDEIGENRQQVDKRASTMRVDKGKMHKENPQKKLNEKGHELKLREMMIPKKRRRVYAKMKHGIKRKIHEQKILAEKRSKLAENVE